MANDDIQINVEDSQNSINIDVTDPENPAIDVNVSGGESSMYSLDVSGDKYYLGMAKDWAVKMDGKVAGEDYSSKYYATQAKGSELIVTEKKTQIDELVEDAENYATSAQSSATSADLSAQSAQSSAEYIVNNAPTATIEQTATGAIVTTTDLTHGTTTAVLLNGAKGETGEQGPIGLTGPQGEQGPIGPTGNGVSGVNKISTVGLVDTYRMAFTNGTYFDYPVTNGANGTGSVADVWVNGVSVLDGDTAKVIVPTNNNQLTNGAGYITSSALSGYATEQWVTNQGYTTNVGTVTSVNNVQPVNGNVTLTIPDTSNLANKDLSNLSSTGNSKFQVPLISGTNIKTVNNTSILGSGNITIQSAPDTDNVTISTNSDDELQAIGVIDNNSGSAIKTWTGTKAQYDAIVTKDATTLYNIVDDTDTTLTLLELLFPVGAVYFGTMSVCPLQTLGVGTWQALPPDKVIQIAGTRGSVGDTLNESLPNITGAINAYTYATNQGSSNSAIWTHDGNTNNNLANGSALGKYPNVSFDASRSSSTYQDNAPVQQDAYLLRGWERIS